MEISSPKLEKPKKTHPEKISYIFPKNVFPYFEMTVDEA